MCVVWCGAVKGMSVVCECGVVKCVWCVMEEEEKESIQEGKKPPRNHITNKYRHFLSQYLIIITTIS